MNCSIPGNDVHMLKTILGGLTGRKGITRMTVLVSATVAGVTLLPAAPATANLEGWRWTTNTVCVQDGTINKVWPVAAAVWRVNNTPDMYAVTKANCSGTTQKVWVSQYNQADGRCGVTTVWTNGAHRTLYARVQLNTHYPSCLSSSTRRAHVVSHEILHAFGIAHTNRQDTVMSTTNWSYDHYAYMTAYDNSELERMYPW